MPPPLVSIVIPCYNQANYLGETVASALNSNYPSLEIIIIDDGSTDGSTDLGRELADSFEHVFFFEQANAGPSVARNHGIRKSSGKYVLPLDADDLITPDYIRKGVEVLEADNEVKVVYCGAEKFGDVQGKWNLKPFSRERLAQGNMIYVSALFRKEDWEKVGGFAEEMTWGFEDWEFWISMLKNGGKVVKLPITGFFYRIRKGSRRKGVSSRERQMTYAFINFKHREFIHAHLGGPIRRSKSWSKIINRLLTLIGLDPRKSR
jgi:glycosyltransferase involved in cell wall biosynthesis